MKKKNMEKKIKYKNHIKNGNRRYNVNPDIAKIEITPQNINDLDKILNNQLLIPKIDSNVSSDNFFLNFNLDAKIKHRKKRDGD
ncbi:MAG: hypothetical protein ACFFAN_18610 [Promethearchaeota archaeon]